MPTVLHSNALSYDLILPSSLPRSLNQLNVDICDHAVPKKEFDWEGIAAFQKAANYLAAAMIYLRSNVLLEKPLDAQRDLKPRLLGHFGTCPGMIMLHTHLTAMIKRHEVDQQDEQSRFLFVAGPGHGAPAVLAVLYLEGTISLVYADESLTKKGLHNFVKAFSWPGSPHPSHVNATTPGCIHEGGELGYALVVSYGAVMDKPDLIVAVVVGDGENETGPSQAAWHSHKFIDPKESGAVLPILHVNRFKIAESTIYGEMDEAELLALFAGFGFQPRIVNYYHHTHEHTAPGDAAIRSFDEELAATFEWAYSEIRAIQSEARSGNARIKAAWPMIIFISPKGWGLPAELDGKPLEGSFRTHQVPISNTVQHLPALEKWLCSYDATKWFQIDDDVQAHNGHSKDTASDYDALKLHSDIMSILPSETKRMGRTVEAYGGGKTLSLPDWTDFASSQELTSKVPIMDALGQLLAEVARRNPHDIRVFSPDELISNHLGSLLSDDKLGGRNFQHAAVSRDSGGRVIEILSEHCCMGYAQGYTITGGVAVFPSYEAFLTIVSSQIAQYAKFIKQAREISFRNPFPSITLLESSDHWNQSHNGYSHQGPHVLSLMCDLPRDVARVYLPPDVNTALSTLHHCLKGKGHINLLVASKEATSKSWLTAKEAEAHCIAGCGVWPQYGTFGGENPDVTLVGIGVQTTQEVIAAARIVAAELPHLRIRVVNITDLLILAPPEGPSAHPHALNDDMLESLLGPAHHTGGRAPPVVFNFHGYLTAIKGLVSPRLAGSKRVVRFHGYEEEGTTTTPYSMLRLNHVDRYSLAKEILSLMSHDALISVKAATLSAHYTSRNRFQEKYAEQHGEDPQEFVELPPLRKVESPAAKKSSRVE